MQKAAHYPCRVVGRLLVLIAGRLCSRAGVRHSIPEGRQQLFALAENFMPAMHMPWSRSTVAPVNDWALFQYVRVTLLVGAWYVTSRLPALDVSATGALLEVAMAGEPLVPVPVTVEA